MVAQTTSNDVLKPYGSGVSTGFMFRCPGCEDIHPVRTSKAPDEQVATWTFNGDLQRPTFQPSYLTWWDEWVGEGQPARPCRCHSFVREGQIQFLGDCTHALAGKTVPLPVWVDK